MKTDLSILCWLLAWFPMIVLAIANGVARQKLYLRRLGDLRAHQVSTLVAVLLFWAYALAAAQLLPRLGTGSAWAVGLCWFFMTVAFEILFGRLRLRMSWSRLFHDYNVFKGRVWVLLLLWLLCLPRLVARAP